jgi:hypothetical protein
MDKVVAFGPPQEELPVYPEVLFVLINGISDGSVKIIRLDNPDGGTVPNKEFVRLLSTKLIQIPPEPFGLQEGMWPVVEHDGIQWHPSDQILRLKSERAKEFLRQGQGLIKSDPIQAIKLIKLSGILVGTDLKELYSHLDSIKREDETLVEAYERTEKLNIK